MAIKSYLEKHRIDLEYRVLVVQWKDGDENFTPVEGDNYLIRTTMPVFVGKGSVALLNNLKTYFFLNDIE